jgi:hypothetical protein
MTGRQILYTIYVIFGLIGCAYCGRMLAMQYSYRLYSWSNWRYYVAWVLSIVCLGATAWMALLLMAS